MKLFELKAALSKLQSGRPDLFEGELQLNGHERIVNIPAFIDSHITALEANSGNRTFLPFYERLMRLYEILSEKGNFEGCQEPQKSTKIKKKL